ncbi:hypothetical protein NDR87_10615 [Nocardia sp. CDC159]|uniref:Uncharacterized protein n=1 Tax=Nocardia pulmonis TaxID=2951408 RepID=A0A9X2E429_9NOCA|nr:MULTISPECIES: hypothetical protein [Nocardia]MCM6773922.1 hypothetical protein [Nocardia pulmonis]MCM6786809.1 hypothetical protein [Nocardia sp. CDC159]
MTEVVLPPRKTGRKRRWPYVLTACGVTVVLVAATVWFVILRNPGSTYAELDATDKAMFDQLTRQYEAFATQPDKLWDNDYRYDKKPLILVRARKDRGIVWRYLYLVNVSGIIDTSGYRKIDFPGNAHLRDVHATKTLGPSSLALLFPANFTSLDLNGTEVLAFKYHPGMVDPDRDPLMSFPYFSMHEAFHYYKQANWTFDRNGRSTHVQDYPYDPDHMSLLRTEFALLDRLGAEPDPAVFTTMARDLAAIRAARYHRWPQLVPQDNAEAIEGSARYLERRYSDLIGGKVGLLTNRDGASTTFTAVLTWIEQNPSRNTLLERTLAYETGAQLGYILDRLEPRWKKLMDPAPIGEHLTQHDILNRHFGITAPPADDELVRIQQSYR